MPSRQRRAPGRSYAAPSPAGGIFRSLLVALVLGIVSFGLGFAVIGLVAHPNSARASQTAAALGAGDSSAPVHLRRRHPVISDRPRAAIPARQAIDIPAAGPSIGPEEQRTQQAASPDANQQAQQPAEDPNARIIPPSSTENASTGSTAEVPSAPVTSAPPAPEAPVGQFVVNIGRFRTQAGAESAAELARARGFDTTIHTYTRHGRVRYRVQEGVYASRANADGAVEKLIAAGMNARVSAPRSAVQEPAAPAESPAPADPSVQAPGRP